MTIERTSSEIIIKLPSYVDIEGVQRLLDFLLYKELTAKSEATQAQVDELVQEVKKGRWERKRDRFIK